MGLSRCSFSMALRLGFLFSISLFQVLCIASMVSAESSIVRHLLQSNAITRERHSEGYCAMYDICGQRNDNKVLNCPYSVPSPDDLLSSKIQSLCPIITSNVCCTEAQFDTLRAQVQQAIPFLVSCPACLRNFLNLFCELTCSPNQSLFINVTSVSKVNNNLTVDGIDSLITDAFGEGLYNSCKDVKFGTMNTRAMDFIGSGAQNFKEWFASLVDEQAMNVSTYSCGDVSMGCSSGDCPSRCVLLEKQENRPSVSSQ